MVENHQHRQVSPTRATLRRARMCMNWLKMTAIIATTAATTITVEAQNNDAVRYLVRFPAPQTHYVSVEALLPTAGQAEIEVFMPVWTPGSYLVREYARNIEAISVADQAGKQLTFVKSRKNRWRVETGGAAEIRFSYRVYCREMSVRTNWVEDSFALLNGAPTFVTLVGGLQRPHDVRLELPPQWKTTMTGLPEAPGHDPHHYLAPDYDTLVDSPIVAGNPAVYRFEVDGIPHFLVNQGEAGVWDGPRSAADAEKIVRQYREMWGSLPYKKYVFLNMITEAGGGLEHRNSVCMMTSRWATRTRRGYLGWLDLAAHEYFHAWNIKRLRPVELGPFDYENENPTRSLWIAEGITDYYAPLTVRRAGLSTTQEYLGTDTPPSPGSLSTTIASLQSTPGRLLQSAEQASYDAWIKLYRPDENSANTSISYYTKGAVVGWLLDARIQHATDGKKSLDDLMRAAFAQFSGDHGYTPEQFRATAEHVAGRPLDDFFRRSVESTEELDYMEALEWFGLGFRNQKNGTAGSGKMEKAALGVDTRTDNGRLIVSRVLRDSPAFESGLSVDDEIIAIDEFRVRPDQLAQRLENYRPGDKVSVLVARRDQLMRHPLTLTEEPKRWQLELLPGATSSQKQHLEKWLASSR
jgi:predicted metalloprotease with PDZ domain